ncbi:MAG: peptidase M14 [Deltaproteobacteria bacterium]|nr:peptidase M14 [Deltaproteobacteria bacterium]
MSSSLVGLAVFGAVACAGCSSAPRTRADLTTTAERSAYARTGRYDEVVQLCRDFARSYAGVHCDTIGTTGEGRPIVAVRVARRAGAPAIFIQGGIHAGEIEGKDAGFAFLRDLLDGRVAPGVLDAVSLIFVPVLNPDGHERFGPNHRPNQRGPVEMGFRTNGARLNLNRDYVKAETPEIRAVIRVLRERAPVMLVDLHATDGAKFEHDISINAAPVAPRADGLDRVAAALSRDILARLAQRGHLPVPFYPSFVDDEDPQSGFAMGEAPPRFSQNYAAARGMLGVLVETHSWRTYPERVKSTYHTLLAICELAVRDAGAWQRAVAAAQQAALPGKVTLAWKNGPRTTMIAFRGYAYEKVPSEISGGTWLVYDEQTPQIWNVPLHDELVPAIDVDVPRAGYIVDGGFAAQVAAVLDRHGIRHVPILEGTQPREVEAFRATKVTPQGSFEGRARVTVEGAWAPERRTLERGAIFVPIAQPNPRLVLHLFEPELPDSLVQWGYFNAAFERKEYMEPYVAEEMARAMLAKDPSLRAAFDAALAADSELAQSPARRLDWFYRRSPAWDERVDLVPVFRTSATPETTPETTTTVRGGADGRRRESRRGE